MKNHEIMMDCILTCLWNMKDGKVEIRSDSDFVDELGLDSMGTLDLMLQLEEQFDIVTPFDLLPYVRTPAQLTEVLVPQLDAIDATHMPMLAYA